VQYPVRHLQSHNINATSPANTQRVTHIYIAVQQDCLPLKLEATRPFVTSRAASHSTRTETSVRIRNDDERISSFLSVRSSFFPEGIP